MKLHSLKKIQLLGVLLLGLVLGYGASYGIHSMSLFDGTFIIVSTYATTTPVAQIEAGLSSIDSIKEVHEGTSEQEIIVRLDANDVMLFEIKKTMNYLIESGGTITYVNVGYTGF